jgi:hypothetical protein
MTEMLVPYENTQHHNQVQQYQSSSFFFNLERFDLAQRVAKVFSESTMVPTQFQKNLPNCLIALNLAERMKTDPFMLMQNMYIVHGKPGIEAKLAIGLMNNSGRFSNIQYKMSGSGDAMKCVAYAKNLHTGEVCEGPEVSIDMAKKEGWMDKAGSKWKTMPELMLRYRSATFFARLYCPDVLLGMHTHEELIESIEMERTDNGSFEVKEKTKDKIADLKEKIKNGNGNGKQPDEVSLSFTDEYKSMMKSKAQYPELYKEAVSVLGKPEKKEDCDKVTKKIDELLLATFTT